MMRLIAPRRTPVASFGGQDESAEQEGDLEPALTRVVRCEGCYVTTDSTPLSPSRPRFAGDHGWVEGVPVVHVEKQGDGYVHSLDSQLFLEPDQVVEVRINDRRHDRLARTHTGCVLIKTLMKWRRIPVLMVEVAAGMAWIEIGKSTSPIDLDSLAAFAVPLRPTPLDNGYMAVECAGMSVNTTLAPIALNSNALAGAEVRTVGTSKGGGSTLELVLPDGKGNWSEALS